MLLQSNINEDLKTIDSQIKSLRSKKVDDNTTKHFEANQQDMIYWEQVDNFK